MKLKDVMTRRVETLSPDDSLIDAAHKMQAINVGVIPVCDENDRVVGVLTDRDIVVRGLAQRLSVENARVADCMTRDVISGFEEQDIKEAASIMGQNQIRRMPVLDRNQQIIGIVSLGDLAVRGRDERLIAETLSKISEPARPELRYS